MNQAFNTLFDFNKGTVIFNADNFTSNLGADRVVFGGVGPGIFFELFDAQGNPLPFGVVFDNLNINGLADIDALTRMVDPAPGDIGNMEESVKAAKIDESTIIGDVFNDTFNGSPFLEFFQELLFHALANLFQNYPAGDNDIVAFLIMFKNPELITLAD